MMARASRRFLPVRGRLPALAACLSLAACSVLLPTGKSHTPLPWSSYAEAISALDRIEPYVTTRARLAESGIDPGTNPSITILGYGDLLQRFAAIPAVPHEALERGISDCLNAGRRCTAYALSVREVSTQRIGNFWLDALNFRRHTVTTGWSLNALVVFVDDTVVYVLTGGQPAIHEEQFTQNPLGPLQGIGESLRPPIR